MGEGWERQLERWRAAGLLDDEAVARIRAWESARRNGSLRWPAVLALAFGVVLVGAGILLLVSSGWNEFSPAQRLAVVTAAIAALHVAGALLASKWPNTSVAFHAAGTVALGAGVAVAVEMYNLRSDWSLSILFWAIGAGAAWLLLRHWTQAAMFALLAPAWLGVEWLDLHSRSLPALCFWIALAFVYLSARQKWLLWLGGVFLIPLVIAAATDRSTHPARPFAVMAAAWTATGLLPAAAGFLLRRDQLSRTVPFIAWSLLLAGVNDLAQFAWCAMGAIGLTAWGVRDGRPGHINLGIAGFAITVLAFFSSNLLDKMSRSASLVILGLLFLGGGWLLERTRRRLVEKAR